MFQSPLWLSSGSLMTSIQLIYNNSRKSMMKPLNIKFSMTNLMVIQYQNCKFTFLFKHSKIGDVYVAHLVDVHSWFTSCVYTTLPIKYKKQTVYLAKEWSLQLVVSMELTNPGDGDRPAKQYLQ
jgi:hypothetical protein